MVTFYIGILDTHVWTHSKEQRISQKLLKQKLFYCYCYDHWIVHIIVILEIACKKSEKCKLISRISWDPKVTIGIWRVCPGCCTRRYATHQRARASHILGRRYPVPDIDRLPEKNWPTRLTIRRPKSGSPDIGAPHIGLGAKSHSGFPSTASNKLFTKAFVFETVMQTCLSRLLQGRIGLNPI